MEEVRIDYFFSVPDDVVYYQIKKIRKKIKQGNGQAGYQAECKHSGLGFVYSVRHFWGIVCFGFKIKKKG